MLWIGYHVYDWVNLHKSRGWAFGANCVYRLNRRADELSFEFKSAPFDEGIHRTFVPSSPRKERNLIHRHKKCRTFQFIGQPFRECSSVIGEPFDKIRFENVQMVRPPKMAQVPNHLGSGCMGSIHYWQHGRKIISARFGLDQMPAHTFTRYSQILLLKALIIPQRKLVVPGRRN